MRVLLSDGSGLTARQAATQLADAGHTVEVLSPDPVCLARFTRRVRRVWRVPPYGPDPLRWLGAMLSVYRSAETDVLVPTQEQAAALSACDDLVQAAGVRTAVPPFAALSRVQDKLSAFATLTAVGLPKPEGAILATPAEVAAWDRFPVFMKLPIGTATTGVRRTCNLPSSPGWCHLLRRPVRSVTAVSWSTEELTPVRRDLRAAIPVAVAVAATLARPASWSRFTSGSVASYSLAPAGWRQLRAYRAEGTVGRTAKTGSQAGPEIAIGEFVIRDFQPCLDGPWSLISHGHGIDPGIKRGGRVLRGI